MSAATVVPLSEYLNTSYRPDCDYLEGQLLERNVGEIEHSGLQMALSAWLYNRRKQFGISVFPEQRVQVKPHRFRVPDVCVVREDDPREQIFHAPPSRRSHRST